MLKDCGGSGVEAWLDLKVNHVRRVCKALCRFKFIKGVLVISVNVVGNLWFRDQSFIFLVTLPVHAACGPNTTPSLLCHATKPCNQYLLSTAKIIAKGANGTSVANCPQYNASC